MLTQGVVLSERYRLGERVATGGMGAVWRCTDLALEREVAVKVLLPALTADPEFTTRFRAEARMLAAVRHPGVVAVHDVGRSTLVDGSRVDYLVMEYVDGEPLGTWLRRAGRLDPASTMSVVAQAAEALHTAHLAGIVHRDVKPGNLLVKRDGRVVLVDFGIARSGTTAGITAANVVLGTASYMSPEQAANQPVSPATDIYALGAVAYFCLAGRPPFDGDNPLQVALRHLQDEPAPLPPGTPPPVVALVERAMAKRPGGRYPDAAALADAAAEARDATLAMIPMSARPPWAVAGPSPAGPPPGFPVGAGPVAECVAPATRADAPATPVPGPQPVAGALHVTGAGVPHPADAGAARPAAAAPAPSPGPAGPPPAGHPAPAIPPWQPTSRPPAPPSAPPLPGTPTAPPGAAGHAPFAPAYPTTPPAHPGAPAGQPGATAGGDGPWGSHLPPTREDPADPRPGRRPRAALVGAAATVVVVLAGVVAAATLFSGGDPADGDVPAGLAGESAAASAVPAPGATDATGQFRVGATPSGTRSAAPSPTKTPGLPSAPPAATGAGDPTVTSSARPGSTPTTSAPAKPNPYTAVQACGTGYQVIDSASLTASGSRQGKVYLLYHAGTGYNCVVTLKETAVGTKTPVTAWLEVQGRARATDSGSFAYYAGPVRAKAAGVCVKWGGSTGGASYGSGFEHCD